MVAVGRVDRTVHLLGPAGQETEVDGDDAADVLAVGVVLAVGRGHRGRDRRLMRDAPVPGTGLHD